MMRDGQFFREVGSNLWDPEIRCKEYDAFGIDVQVLSTVPVMFSYWAKPEHALDLSKLLNDHIASIIEGVKTKIDLLKKVALISIN